MRKCVKCDIEKNESDFYHKPDGKTRGRFCKLCESKRCMNRYYSKHDEIKKKGADYRKNNKNIIKKRSAIARSKYNHSKYCIEKNKQYAKDITDSYVKVRLRGWGINNNEITLEMIEEGRVKILLERLKKEIGRGGIKICAKCGLSFSVSNFYTKKYRWKGEEKVQYNNYCKSCSNNRAKTYKK